MKPKTVIISGGGTGGHLYPALVLGRTLLNFEPGLRLVYVGSSRAVEKKIMSAEVSHFLTLPVEGLKGRGWKKVRGLLLLPLAFLKSFYILLKFRPALVVGVGGFSSGPIVLLAALMKKPTVIMEQNALPGFTNRQLGRFVDLVIVSFASSLPYFKHKAVLAGNPVRPEFYALPRKQRETRLTLLVFGGSQGSKFLNDRLLESLKELQELRDSLVIYHQTGERDLERVSQAYRQHGFSQAAVSAYFSPMADYFARADLIICRAGATTCAELIAGRKPALLVPFAQAADNHQEYNARELEKAGGAEVILEKDFRPGLLVERIKYYLEHKEALDRMEENLEKLQLKNVAERIAGLCLEKMNRAAGGQRG
ncbi:MAG: undecaprenyldiphospho-muramoylpentapeptide beta-N-acetylglucosaminyltransferase [Candidatus Aminicenantes bacterium]|nr:undecaprenyldiphospho-muramoylpentapeptide beta-N-acetylglucosaminyltransferase [Candidatus Aminicenantes bacterium]